SKPGKIQRFHTSRHFAGTSQNVPKCALPVVNTTAPRIPWNPRGTGIRGRPAPRIAYVVACRVRAGKGGPYPYRGPRRHGRASGGRRVALPGPDAGCRSWQSFATAFVLLALALLRSRCRRGEHVEAGAERLRQPLRVREQRVARPLLVVPDGTDGHA